jgi:hypothetical protein
MSNLQWHPMMVHFPLALTVIAFLCFIFRPTARTHASAHLAGLMRHVELEHCRRHGPADIVHRAHRRLASEAARRPAIFRIEAYDLGYVHQPAGRTAGSLAGSRHPSWSGAESAVSGHPICRCAGFVVTGYYGGENVYRYALGVSGR